MNSKKIKICISTCKQYCQKTIPILVESLKAAGFPIADILVVEGGHGSDNNLIKNDINTLEVSHNSFELTALIAVVENHIESDFWLLLHDTCRVGLNFCTLLNKADLSCEKIALKKKVSMSIGLYKFEYLIQHSNKLIKQKNIYYGEKEMLDAKNNAIRTEDLLLWKTLDTPCGVFNEVGEGDIIYQAVDEGWYPSATKRKQEYYPQLDLYKLKANWGQHFGGKHPLIVSV